MNEFHKVVHLNEVGDSVLLTLRKKQQRHHATKLIQVLWAKPWHANGAAHVQKLRVRGSLNIPQAKHEPAFEKLREQIQSTGPPRTSDRCCITSCLIFMAAMNTNLHSKLPKGHFHR